MENLLSFRQQLKYERQRRGWSQEDVASKIGSDPRTVARWENGKSFPRPYHRQVLGEIFGKSPEELGLIDEKVESPPSLHPLYKEDLGEAPTIPVICGRDREVAELTAWIMQPHCRIVTVLGMGGIGKTALVAKLVEQIKDTFDYVFWRSLQDAPPLEYILQSCIQFFAGQQRIDLQGKTEEQMLLLLQYLRDYHCLLILDNVESILQPGQRAGLYPKDFASYGRFFQHIGEVQHQSCLLLTSREKPKEVAFLEGVASPVRSLHLAGIEEAAGRALLKDKGLTGSDEQWSTFIQLYSGNPLALKMVSESIQEVFGGDIAAFLDAGEIAFGDINDLLDQQFQRLSVDEQEALYWLAIEREAVALETIRSDMVYPVSGSAMLEALNSLRRRSLIETKSPVLFMLQPVIMEYVLANLVKRASEDFEAETFNTWIRYAFIKAQAKDYIRDSQIRLILLPLAQQLLNAQGKEAVERKVKRLLAMQRRVSLQRSDYAAGNALNLLVSIQSDLRATDFSYLTVRQAYLQNVVLPEVNFSHTHFIESVFKKTFGNILSVAFNPQGDLLATGTATGEIWIYQMPGGIPLLTCHGHTDGVWSLAFHPNGHLLASSSDDQTVRLWETRGQAPSRCLQVWRHHTNRVRAVSFSPDGSLLASGSNDQTICVWDAHTRALLAILRGHNGRVWAVAFSPDGQTLLSGSTDQTVRLWDTGSGRCLTVLRGHTDSVRSVAFSPDGHIVASGGDDQTIRFWDPSKDSCLLVIRGHTNRVWSLAFSPDGTTLVSGSEDQTIRMWERETGRQIISLHGHLHGVRTVTFSQDKRMLASGGDDQSCRLWDISTGDCLQTIQGYTNRVWYLAFAPDGNTLASCSEDQSIRLWDIKRQVAHSPIKILQVNAHRSRSLAFSPDGRILASGGEDETIRLWNLNTGDCVETLQGHTNWVRTVAFRPDGHMLASGGEDNTVRLWDLREQDHDPCIFVLRGHTDWIRSVAFSPDGSMIASGSDDHTVRLWHIDSDKDCDILRKHTNQVRCVAFHPVESILASGGEDQAIYLWDIRTGQCLKELQGHTGRVLSVTFSPDGQHLASGSDDQDIRLWHIGTERCLHILQGHTNRVRAVTFNRDGLTLASGGDDGAIKLWSVQTGTCLKTGRSEKPYEGTNITAVKGLTIAQKIALRALGAIEDPPR